MGYEYLSDQVIFLHLQVDSFRTL